MVVHELLGAPEVLAAAAFDHVGRKRPRAAGKADQRRPAVQFAPDQGHGVHHVAEVVARIDGRQRFHVRGAADGFAESGPFAFGEMESKIHGVGNGQDVGEKNRRVEGVALQRLQGDFTGELRIPAQAHEVAGAFA